MSSPALKSPGLDPDKIVDIDLASETLRQNFQIELAKWAQRPPFYVMAHGAAQLVCGRYDDVMQIYGDRERFSVEPPRGPGFEHFDRFLGVEALTQIDGARHDRLRRLAGPTFSPAAVARLEDRIRVIVDDLLDSAEAKAKDGIFDGMTDFSAHLMVRILLGAMFGLNEEQKKIFVTLNSMIAVVTHLTPGSPHPPECVKAFADGRRTVAELIEERRAKPGDDLISGLIAARDEGDRLTDRELFDLIFVLCAAALSSTASAMGGVLYSLCRHPDQFDAVKADLSLVPAAVEECLRYHGPGFLSFARFATCDSEVGGTAIFKGMPVILSQQAACYDPVRYPDPLRFDIRRDPKAIAIFGGGVHHCLGNRLARLALKVSLERIATRFPRIALADPDFVPHYDGEVSETHLTSLPLRIH